MSYNSPFKFLPPVMERPLQLVIVLLSSSCLCRADIPKVLFIRANSDTVAMYDRYQLSLDFKADFTNPFDPQEVSLKAVMTSPSGKTWNINGFFNYNSWQSQWQVRFAPNETGRWSYQLYIEDKNGVNDSTRNYFQVIPSKINKGPVRVAPNNRYLQYDNGDTYYGVGLWYNDGYAAFNRGQIKETTLDELKALGVNFISSFITPLETQASGVGRYDQSISGRLDEVLQMLEERDMQLSLNIWFHAFLSETVWGGGNIRWNTNPYRQITEAKDFYRSEDAWKAQENLYRYMIARWGYSKAMMLWFIVDEVNGTDGWTSGDSLQATVWGKKVHDYFKANDPYQHLTTGTRSGGIGEYWHEGYQIFDLPSREIYEAQGFSMIKDGGIANQEEHPLVLSYNNYAGQVTKLWTNYEKPAIIGETGWDHTYYEPSMPGYQSLYHNALWVSLANGTAMSPFWWAYSGYLNDNIITNQIRSLSRFTKEIPFAKLTHVSKIDTISGGHDAFAITSDQMIFGWVADPMTDVTGATISLTLKNTYRPLSSYVSKYKVRVYHTWRGAFIYEGEAMVTDGNKLSFTLPVLKPAGGHGNYMGQDAAFILEPMK